MHECMNPTVTAKQFSLASMWMVNGPKDQISSIRLPDRSIKHYVHPEADYTPIGQLMVIKELVALIFFVQDLYKLALIFPFVCFWTQLQLTMELSTKCKSLYSR